MLRAPFVLLYNLFKLLRYLWAAFWNGLGHWLSRKKRKYVAIKLERDYAFGPGRGLAALFQTQPTFLEFRQDIKRLAGDPKIEGVVITIETVSMGPARAEEFRGLIGELVAAGKRVVVHFQMMTLRDYALATAADEILVTPAGRLYIFGLRFEQYFAADLLERLGVAAQFVHIGPFKTASHRFIHNAMTDPQRLMMQNLFDGLTGLYERQIAGGRGLDVTDVRAAFSHMPLDVRDAMRLKLVDGEAFRTNVSRWLAQGPAANSLPGPPDKEIRLYQAHNYLNSNPTPFKWTPLFRTARRFAVMDLTGMIVMPDMNLPGSSGASINPSEVLPRLRALKKDRSVAGVVLHINSPGGSALASDLLWHAIQDLRTVKPVIAYCSDLAASGGYYLAVAADKIVCRPQTVTGSIGVIAGKMSFPGALEKVGINVESIYDDEATSFTSLTHPLSDRVLQNLQHDARSFYRRFLQRVGEARGLSKRRLHRYARGRVYTGEDAYRRGLVDVLGGFDEAIALLATLAKLDAKTTEVEFVAHRRQTIKSAVRKSFILAELEFAQPLLGELAQAAAATAMLRHEPVLALTPYQFSTQPS
ncbi:MAG: signal peptide peptidase SppA [Bradymonadaceae bacterium]|nr:signal peptide peptidase SppA [Lujinxingiaceae bacterium]